MTKSASRCRERRPENEVSGLPYHHDWKPLFETSLGLRVKWFGRWGGDPNWFIEPSRLGADLVCFFYLEAGECAGVINGVERKLKPGELVVLRGADVFSYSQNPEKPQISLSACLSLDRDSISNELMQLTYKRHYRIKNRKAYEDRFQQVMDTLDSKSDWSDLHITAAILQWLAELQDLLKPEREGGDNAKTVHHVLKAQDWMQERLGEEITVQAWAEASGLNTDYFSRLFKTHTGMAPRAWLIEARLQRASRTLASSDAAIAEVSAISGFNCPFHFSRTFKKRFGIPPAKYRKLHQLQSLTPT